MGSQLFYSFFKTLVGKEIAVELKNDVALTGTLHSVDQYLNVKLTEVQVVDAERYPQLVRFTLLRLFGTFHLKRRGKILVKKRAGLFGNVNGICSVDRYGMPRIFGIQDASLVD